MDYAIVRCFCNKKIASLEADSYFIKTEAPKFIARGYDVIYMNELDSDHEWATQPCPDCNCPWAETYSTSVGFKKI